MLTLTRRVGESIVIELPSGETIEIVAKQIRRNQVRIGVIAPRDLRIYREEVWNEMQAESAAEVAP